VVAPRWALPVLPVRMLAQPVVELVVRRRMATALAIAREETVELTTAQPDRVA
jgi:hypothetical protein